MKIAKTHLLDGLFCYTVNLLGNLVDLVRLGVVDQTVTSKLQTGADVLAVLELLELGGGLCLGDLFAGDLTGGNLLDGINGGLGGLGDSLGGSGDGGVEETGVGVDGAGGLDLGSLSSGLAELGEALRPLDGRLASKERAEDGDLGLVKLAGEGAGAGESNDHGVAAVVGDTLLTTVVLGLVGTGVGLLERGAGDVLEELANPLGELAVVGTVGDDGEVGLRVGDLGVPLNGLGVEVLGVGRGRSGGGGDTEAAVEGEAVGGLGGHVGDAGEELLVGEVDHGEHFLGVDVGCTVSIPSCISGY